MYRNILNELNIWFNEPRRRILYIKGALGVGKTWTVKDFAFAYFEHASYVNVSAKPCFSGIISGTKPYRVNADDYNMTARIEDMELLLQDYFQIEICENSIFIFDEMQDIQGADEFFHQFTHKHRYVPVCLIASTTAVTEYQYHHKDVYNIVQMGPMSFEEYLIANKATPFIASIKNSKNRPLNTIEEATLLSYFKEYAQVGGMPAAVKTYISTRDLQKVRNVQLELLSEYEAILKKHPKASMAQRIRRIWHSLPKQLTNQNKKFMYKYVETNARAREYEEAVQSLCDYGFARRLPRLIEGVSPLEQHIDHKAFELFMLDHGLLRASLGLDMNEDRELIDLLEESEQATAEQIIFEELTDKVESTYYWVSRATSRVPFVYECAGKCIPVAIRFTENKKAQSIKTFMQKNPGTDISLKISLNQVFLENGVLNIPIYGLWNM